MGVVTPNISIYIPSAGETNYDAPFSAGMVNIDQHDHTGGPNKGVPIGTGGIADGSVTFAKLNLPSSAPRQMFQSGAGITPAWSTSTWPATTTANRILYSSANNVVAEIATANNGILVTSNAGVPSILAGPGTTGNILQSNAAAPASYSTATYPSVATGTGTILRANGTNWVPSTAQYPDTAGAVGNVMTSNGTDWVSSSPADGGITLASGTLTNSEIKNLNATPITLIAAPGAGKVIVVLQAIIKLNYGGSNPFLPPVGARVNLYYGTTRNALGEDWITIGNLSASASTFNTLSGLINVNNVYSNMENIALMAYNPNAEIAGNAANDNTISWNIMYYIATI